MNETENDSDFKPLDSGLRTEVRAVPDGIAVIALESGKLMT